MDSLKSQLGTEKKRYKELTDSKREVDKQLIEARVWCSEYEKGFGKWLCHFHAFFLGYNLEAAVKEIRQLKISMHRHESETEELLKVCLYVCSARQRFLLRKIIRATCSSRNGWPKTKNCVRFSNLGR